MTDPKFVSSPLPGASTGAESAATPMEVKDAAGTAGVLADYESRAAKNLLGVGKAVRTTGTITNETVLGTDSRVRIIDTDLPPWNMICALRLKGRTGTAIGTGWLAGPKTIVTAGHCVFHSGFFGGWVSEVEVSAGRNDDTFPFGTIKATRFSALEKWEASEDPDFDVGCIHLDEALGSKTKVFAVVSPPPETLADFRVNISGYPSDRGAGKQQFFHSNNVLSVSQHRVFYDVDTFGGQSGAPVWIHESENAPPKVVAVHAYGTGGTPFDMGIKANSAPRITPALFDIIEGWVAEDGGR